MAQLQLYGIPFKKSDTGLDLKVALQTAVNAGKVWLLLFFSFLFCFFFGRGGGVLYGTGANLVQMRQCSTVYCFRSPNIPAVSTTSGVYKEAVLKRRAEVFSHLESPTIEAAYDPDLFLACPQTKKSKRILSFSDTVGRGLQGQFARSQASRYANRADEKYIAMSR